MSVDKELERALEEAEAEGVEAVAPAAVSDPTPEKPKRNLGLLAALLVMGGAILAMVFTSFQGSMSWSLSVDRLLAEKDRYAERNLKVTGILVKGTLSRRDEPCEYRFRIEKAGAELPVHYAKCVVPDTFRDMPGMDVEVTASGKLDTAGHFEATEIMAKCPSKYEMKERAASGEAAPHAGQQASPLQAYSQE
jgi:cytochrome c-type biogenesis protein CcmE